MAHLVDKVSVLLFSIRRPKLLAGSVGITAGNKIAPAFMDQGSYLPAVPPGKHSKNFQHTIRLAAKGQSAVCAMHRTHTQQLQHREYIFKVMHIHVSVLCQVIRDLQGRKMEEQLFSDFLIRLLWVQIRIERHDGIPIYVRMILKEFLHLHGVSGENASVRTCCEHRSFILCGTDQNLDAVCRTVHDRVIGQFRNQISVYHRCGWKQIRMVVDEIVLAFFNCLGQHIRRKVGQFPGFLLRQPKTLHNVQCRNVPILCRIHQMGCRTVQHGPLDLSLEIRGGHQSQHRAGTGGLTQQGDTLRVTAEIRDILDDPIHRCHLIPGAAVGIKFPLCAGKAGKIHTAKGTKPVLNGNHHNISRLTHISAELCCVAVGAG